MGRLPVHTYFAGAGLFTATAYSSYRYIKYHRDAADLVSGSHDSAKQQLTSSDAGVFDALSEVYDQAVGSEETWMGYGLLRSWILRHAKGKVLEISAGTGRSFPHYNYDNVSSLTVTDLSKHMLEQAEEKYYDKLRIGYKHPDTLINFAVSDAHCMALEEPGQPSAPEPSRKLAALRSWWDYLKGSKPQEPDPAPVQEDAEEKQPPKLKPKPLPGAGSPLNLFRVLVPGWLESSKEALGEGCCCGHGLAPGKENEFSDENFRERCARGSTESGIPLKRFRPNTFDTVVDAFGLCSHDDPVQVLEQAARVCKPDGRVLLLEHGRSSYDWWNGKLSEGAEGHRKKWGCWWNRDILKIVDQAGLDVEYISRWHFGTSYVLIARPRKGKQLLQGSEQASRHS